MQVAVQAPERYACMPLDDHVAVCSATRRLGASIDFTKTRAFKEKNLLRLENYVTWRKLSFFGHRF
jgi:hypothetical protein